MKWFTLVDEKIEGPYPTDVLLRKIETQSLAPETLIWGPLQVGWKPLEWWQQALPHLKAVNTEIESFEQWYYVRQGQRIGPLSREELITQLKALKESEPVAKLLIWTKGYKQWTPVIEDHELMNTLGLDQRKHPRVRAQGRLLIQCHGQTHIAPLLSLSEGGLGTDVLPMVYPGEEVSLSIESEELGGSIAAKAEIRYIRDNHTGLQFTALNSEAKASIVTFVKNKMSVGHRSAA
jgi:hypothetical protein